MDDQPCRDCGQPVQDAEECRVSGLCLLCLNGPVPGRCHACGKTDCPGQDDPPNGPFALHNAAAYANYLARKEKR